jgi:hypothetical protein
MADFDSLHRISLGPATFQLVKYMPKWTPEIKDGVGRTGTIFSMTGEGYIQADTLSAFATALNNVRDAFNVSGQSVVVYGPNNTEEFRINPADCNDQGPHVGLELLDQTDDTAMMRTVRFTVNAKLILKDAAGGPVAESYRVTEEHASDTTQKVTYAGTLSGPNARAYLISITEPRLRALYDPRVWVENLRFDAGQNDSDIKYTISFEELKQSLGTPPLGDVQQANAIVDGLSTYRNTRDDQQRKVEVYGWDLLLSSANDFQNILDVLRRAQHDDQGQPKTPLTESVELTGLRQIRLRAEYTYLSSGSGDKLLEWEQTIAVDIEDPVCASLEYPGIDAVIYRPAQPARGATQSGRARAVGDFPKIPATFFDERFLSKRRRPTRRIVNEVEYEVSWSYEFLFVSGTRQPAEWIAALKRPSSPSFGF